MRNVSSSVYRYLEKGERQIKVKLSFPKAGGTDDITTVQTLDYDCSFGNSLAIGNTVSASVKVTCETPAFSIQEREFTLYFGADPDGSGIQWTKIGIFKTVPKSTESRMGFTTFTAYDRMYINTNKIYSATGETMSMRDLLSSVCGKAGLSVPAITYNPQVDARTLDEYTLRDAIGFIAGYQGKNAYIDCDGNLTFRWFTSCGYSPDESVANVPFADEKDTQIQILVCSTGDDNIQAGTGIAETQTLKFNNPFMTPEHLEILKENIKGFTYRRLDADVPVGNYSVESGDIVHIGYTGQFQFTVPVMSVSYHYDGGLSCKFSSYGVPDGVMASISAKKFRDHTKFNGLQKEIVHATEQITGATGGYVRINFGDDGKTAEIMILDQPEADKALNVWRWNQGGLGHSSNGYNGPFDDVALTADGHIVAERITGKLISGVGLKTISDVSYLFMDKGHITFQTKPSSDSETSNKIAGMYAMHLYNKNGMMMSCPDGCWIDIGRDVVSGSIPAMHYDPQESYPFTFFTNVRMDDSLEIKKWYADDRPHTHYNVAGKIYELEKAVDALEALVGGMFKIIEKEE